MKIQKILITGAHGMLGSALSKQLRGKYEICQPTSKELNLLNLSDTERYFSHNGPFDCVFHLAAKVGGVKSNMQFQADFFDQNTRINLNVLEASKNKVKKLISLLSTCIYPDFQYITYPLTEDQLHLGPPHVSNFGYAYSKRMLHIQSKSYNQQFGMSCVCAVPNNLFGERDNYDLENGHVIPSLIRKIWEAKISYSPSVEIWGSGNQLREFTYSKDAAEILIRLMKEYDDCEPINIGNTKEYKISDVANAIKTNLKYEGELVFDISKPEGQYRKNSSNQKLLDRTSWTNDDYTDFEKALKQSCLWFASAYPNVRGKNV